MRKRKCERVEIPMRIWGKRRHWESKTFDKKGKISSRVANRNEEGSVFENKEPRQPEKVRKDSVEMNVNKLPRGGRRRFWRRYKFI